jgi:hypothetical protein
LRRRRLERELAGELEFHLERLFQTLGTRIVAGRDLTWTDFYERRLVALVPENLARDEWQSAAQALVNACGLRRQIRGARSSVSWETCATTGCTAIRRRSFTFRR